MLKKLFATALLMSGLAFVPAMAQAEPYHHHHDWHPVYHHHYHHHVIRHIIRHIEHHEHHAHLEHR